MAPFLFSGQSIAQVLESPYGRLSPGLDIRDESDLAAVFSMVSTLQILDRDEPVVFGNLAVKEELNYFFASGPDFISGQRVSTDALEALPDELSSFVRRQPTHTDVCYVQGFDTGIHPIVVSIHDSSEASKEDIFKCFVASVWYFKNQDVDKYDPDNWRNAYISLISGEH
ncbi:MAG: hypothetical protein AAFX90_03450 [Pseudomonadota bacterium]